MLLLILSLLTLIAFSGTEIWRIEDFQPVALPKSEYGKFYMGDSYIVLQVCHVPPHSVEGDKSNQEYEHMYTLTI